jgi:hypothetical protein
VQFVILCCVAQYVWNQNSLVMSLVRTQGSKYNENLMISQKKTRDLKIPLPSRDSPHNSKRSLRSLLTHAARVHNFDGLASSGKLFSCSSQHQGTTCHPPPLNNIVNVHQVPQRSPEHVPTSNDTVNAPPACQRSCGRAPSTPRLMCQCKATN